MRSPAWGRRCAQPSTGAGRSQAPSGTGNFARGCHVHEGVPAGPLGSEEGISGTARGPPCPPRMARCSAGTPCPGQAPGPGPASSRPPSVDSAWGGAGRAGRRGVHPPARVAAGRAAPAPAVRQRLLTQKRLSAPQPPARVVPTALAPSRPCRLVIGVYLWSVWCTWRSGDALERSVERTETDACRLGTPFPSKGETSGRAAGLGQAGGPHGRSRRPVQPCAQQAGPLPRVQSL